MIKPIYKQIACLIQAIHTCYENGNQRWLDSHSKQVEYLIRNYLPSGSGVDCGTKFLSGESSPEKLVFLCEFHHMNDDGVYTHWTEHKVIVTSSLTSDIDLRITGKHEGEIKVYLADLYYQALTYVLTDSDKAKLLEYMNEDWNQAAV